MDVKICEIRFMPEWHIEILRFMSIWHNAI